MDETIAKFGGIDVLVNNAAFAKFGNLEEQTSEDLDSIFAVNLKAPILITKAALPHLKKTRGAIVNVSSIASTFRSNSKSRLISRKRFQIISRSVFLRHLESRSRPVFAHYFWQLRSRWNPRQHSQSSSSRNRVHVNHGRSGRNDPDFDRSWSSKTATRRIFERRRSCPIDLDVLRSCAAEHDWPEHRSSWRKSRRQAMGKSSCTNYAVINQSWKLFVRVFSFFNFKIFLGIIFRCILKKFSNDVFKTRFWLKSTFAWLSSAGLSAFSLYYAALFASHLVFPFTNR